MSGFDVAGQVVLVTGGTKGIGRAIVEQFVTAGARVAFCAVDPGECASVEAEIRAQLDVGADRLFAQAADLRDRPSLRRLLDAVLERWGHVDTLICNAADFGGGTAIEEVDCERFESLLQANLVGTFYLCQQTLPLMAARGSGSAILMTSIVGFTTMPNNIPYSSSKAAISSMGRSLAAAYAASNVRVNLVSPGLIKTDSSKGIWQDEAIARDYIGQRVPMNRIGMPEEIAATCLFLASPAASYITAALIPVDGGRMGVGQPAASPKA